MLIVTIISIIFSLKICYWGYDTPNVEFLKKHLSENEKKSKMELNSVKYKYDICEDMEKLITATQYLELTKSPNDDITTGIINDNIYGRGNAGTKFMKHLVDVRATNWFQTEGVFSFTKYGRDIGVTQGTGKASSYASGPHYHGEQLVKLEFNTKKVGFLLHRKYFFHNFRPSCNLLAILLVVYLLDSLLRLKSPLCMDSIQTGSKLKILSLNSLFPFLNVRSRMSFTTYVAFLFSCLYKFFRIHRN